MGNLRACSVIALLAACGSDKAQPDAHVVTPDAAIDAKIFNDAPPPMFNFACVGNTAPATATATITVGGTVQEVYSSGLTPAIRALAGASVDMCAAGANNCNGPNHYGTTATSDSTGGYSIGPVNTSSVPLDAYLVMTKTGDRTTYVYPDQPATASLPTVPVLTFQDTLIAGLAAFGITQSSANGIVGLALVDCAGTPISDTSHVTLSIKQNNVEVTGTMVIDASTFNSAAAGAFVVFNVPAGATTTVGATYTGVTPNVTLRAHDVQVVAGTTTETIVRPGY